MKNLVSEFSLRTGESIYLGLVSDPHLGASCMHEKALEEDMERMVKAGCKIVINGDVFDVIEPGDVKRFKKQALSERLRMTDEEIADETVQIGIDFFAPYAEHIAAIGEGNHEGHARKRLHTNLIKRLVEGLNAKCGTDIQYVGWCGYWHIKLKLVDRSQHHSWTIYRHHGAGGSAPVTKGIIDFDRMAAWNNADCYWIGHKHNRLCSVTKRAEFNPNTTETQYYDVLNIMTGSYLDTYGDKENGTRASYAEAWNLAPQSKGGAIVMLTPKRTGKTGRVEIKAQAIL